MNNVIEFDNHVWTDCGDGIYTPDHEYRIDTNAGWGVGLPYKDKTFVLEETGVDGVYVIIAMTVDWKLGYKAGIYCDSIANSRSFAVVTLSGFYNDRSMGELKLCYSEK